MALPRRHTVADYDALPDDGRRHELIDGVMIEVTGPSRHHQRVARRLVLLLGTLPGLDDAGEFFFAPFDVELSGDTVVQPDILFVSADRADLVAETRVVGGPDLVVEVSSPTTRDRDLVGKRRAYLAAGVREYWFVDLDERTVTVWSAEGEAWVALEADERGYARSAVLPGLAVDPVALFAEP